MPRYSTRDIEALGRLRLVAELNQAGLDVAIPTFDRGVDLIAYASNKKLGRFAAKPIQLKAASARGFSIDRKYAKIPDLIIAYVWNVQDRCKEVTYAIPYGEAVRIAEILGYTKTQSWLGLGCYVVTNPGSRLVELLGPFVATASRWWELVTETPIDRPL